MTEEQVFLAALDLPDASARSAYLDEACGEDAQLRGKVEDLLAAHFKSGEFMDVPAPVQIDVEPSFNHAVTIQSDVMPAQNYSEPDSETMPFLDPSSRPDSLGRIGHYEVLQVLGVGGFGIVLRAFDDVLQRVVAVKVMAPQLAATSPARKRFLREARSSAQVRHENVVQVYEVGEQPLPHLVMEFIPGETLQQRLDRVGPLDVPESLRIGRQISEGLAAAHAMDLIHRDIKPGNVLLEGAQLKVKITDFGLARAADDASMTQSGQIAGTPMYMAPEQALGHTLDQRADLFSLGSVLYQTVAGRPPFRANTAVAVLKRVVEDTPRNIREIIPETPQWLCDIIAKLHAKDPKDRYQSAREVADVLADCEAQLKANSRLRDFSRIPRGSSTSRGPRWKWAAAAAVLLVPVIALAVTEFAGVTHLFRGQQATDNPIKPGNEPQAKANTGWHGWPADAPKPAAAPFDAAQARAFQEAWAKHLGVPVEYTNSIGMKLRLIPPGEFVMGSPDDDERARFNEKPQHKVSLTQPILLGVHEVTVGQFRRFIEATGYKTDAETSGMGAGYWDFKQGKEIRHPEVTWAKPPFEQAADYPVCCVSWNDAQKFCEWLSRTEGRTYVQPTEAQWEFACRAGTFTRTPFGNNLDPAKVNISESRLQRPCAVGSYKPNAFGLYDMIGNVFEWCRDDLGAYVAESAIDPMGTVEASPERRLRGGAYSSSSFGPTRSACRNAFPATTAYAGYGFRVALVGDLKSPPIKQNSLPPTFKNSIGIEFVIVPKGKSWLGGGKDKLGDKEVEIPADFYLGKYEVTQEEWEKLLGENPSWFARTGRGKDAAKDVPDADLKRFPVEYVSWDLCQTFVEKLNRLEKEAGWVYRLPTEVEWEHACRGGSGRPALEYEFDYYFDQPTNTVLPDQANFSFGEKSLARTCKVGSYKPNRLGLCDMHGNVWEWCQDEVMDKGVSKRPPRGGSWEFDSLNGRAWFRRSPHPPSHRHNTMGLRLARVPVSADSPAAKPPTLATSTFSDADVQRIAALPAAEQVEEVRKELMRLNPGYDGKLEHKIEGDVVTELAFNTDQVDNIAPVRALAGLTSLDCRGTYRDKGKLSDLSPLKGMTLSRLDCSSTQVADLAPLAGMPLTTLHFSHNPVSDLTPLKGMHLEHLGCAETKVSDLSPLKGMKLKTLGAQLLAVTDLSPLEGMPLTGLDLYHTIGVTNLQPLKGMPLEYLNLQDVPVSDLSALQGMTSLRNLHLQGNPLSDLTPLQGLKLSDLTILEKQVSDLSPLKEMPLTRLLIYGSGVTDLRPLQGMPLVEIRLTPMNITHGLEILRDMQSLKTIGIEYNQAWPAAEFWERFDKEEFTNPPAVTNP